MYWGVCPPYLYRERVIYVTPAVVYLDDDTTVYVRARDVRNSMDDYYLAPKTGGTVRDLPEEIREVVFSLRDAFLDANIEPLTKLTDPAVKIAVIRKGKYDYSLAPDDYLDMTRDMLRTAETREFAFLRSSRKSDNVWTLDFLHVYSDTKKEEKRTVVRYAVEKVLGKWVLSQVSVLEDNEK